MYLLLMTSFTAIFISAYILSKVFFNNRSSALIIIVSGLLYLLPTIAGALGILRPYLLFNFALVALLISVFTLRWQRDSKSNGFNYYSIEYCARPISLEVLLVVVPAICSISWILIFVVQSIRHRIALHYISPLPWDVVTYHFPTLVNAIQSGSLWTTFWAHYPMGCEMIHSWGFVFLRNDALVYPTHFFFTIVFIFFSGIILHILCFQDGKALSGTEIIAYLIMTVMLLVSPPLWDMQFNEVGKNDIAMSAFVMAALCFLLQCITETSTSKSFKQNVLLTGIALGILCGIKPHGLLYAVFFLVILLKDSFAKKVIMYSMGVVGLCILLLAGFWYIRPLIMLGTIPPSGVDLSIIFNLHRGLGLFLTGRENILFTLSMVFCLIMGVGWHNKDFRMRVVNYTLAASIVIFWLTPFGAWDGYLHLRYASATIPLVIIMGIATFLRLFVKTEVENDAIQLKEPNYWTYRRGTVLACVLLGLGSVAMLVIPLLGGLEGKPRWAWNLRALIIIGFLAASLYIYNSVKAFKEYRLNMSRSLLSVISVFMVFITLFIQIIFYRPPGDLPGYNENTSVYRWIYENIHGKTIYLLGLRPYGFYGKEFSNRVIYDGDSYGTKLEEWLSPIKQGKADYLIIGRDYAQHEGWYDYKPFPSDLAKILAKPNMFKLVWSDDLAMIFSIEPSFFTRVGSGFLGEVGDNPVTQRGAEDGRK
ncbi:MAG: hypothetical protein WC600_12765 [Desulfobaccales bacterium]